MSNLIKSVYFNVDSQNKAVIDSNEIINNMPIFKQEEHGDFEFVPGINVLNIDDIIEEQKEAMQEDAEQLLEEARAEAARIIDDARKDAGQIYDEAKENGYTQGYNQGMEAASGEIASLKQEYEQKGNELNELFDKMVEEAEPHTVEIICDIVERLTNVVVHDKNDAIIYLIEKSLKELQPSNKYVLHVSPDNLISVMEAKDELISCIGEGAVFDITEDTTLTVNKCIIETDTHVIDCSLDVQLDNLKKELRLISSL